MKSSLNPIEYGRNIIDKMYAYCASHPNVKFHKWDLVKLIPEGCYGEYSWNTVNVCATEWALRSAGLSTEPDPTDARTFLVFFDREAAWKLRQTERELRQTQQDLKEAQQENAKLQGQINGAIDLFKAA